MEIKAELNKPYTENEKINFIIQYNHRLGCVIEETENSLQAWEYTKEEKKEMEKERIRMLKLTRGDVFRGLLQAKHITKQQIRAIIEKMPETTEEEIFKKQLAFIDFDDALEFYRGNPLIDEVGKQLGLTTKQLNNFFETNDYNTLL